MIYYTPYGKVVNTIESEEYELRESVRLDENKGSIAFEGWGNGCLYEGDEFFQSFCMIKYGFQPIMLEEEEYNVLKACGIYYFSKARKKSIRESIVAERKKREEERFR